MPRDMESEYETIEANRVYLRRSRDLYRNMVKVGLPIIVALTAGLVYLATIDRTKVVVSTADGRVITLPDLSEPNMSPDQVLAWTERCVMKTYGIDWVSYRERWTEAQKCWNDQAWRMWTAEFSRKNLPIVLGQGGGEKRILVPQPKGSGALVNSGLDQRGVWTYQIQHPFEFSYQGNTSTRSQGVILEIFVQRVPITQSLQGMQIVQLNEHPDNRR